MARLHRYHWYHDENHRIFLVFRCWKNIRDANYRHLSTGEPWNTLDIYLRSLRMQNSWLFKVVMSLVLKDHSGDLNPWDAKVTLKYFGDLPLLCNVYYIIYILCIYYIIYTYHIYIYIYIYIFNQTWIHTWSTMRYIHMSRRQHDRSLPCSKTKGIALLGGPYR